MLIIDGSQGEGGGQILRTALALSMCLSKPFKIHHIRAARRNPGLQPQHLAAVKAATQISRAEVEGAELNSQTLSFIPGQITGGEYHFSIGTAGSTTLLLQTLLPALILTANPSHLILEGGTHNPFAPPFEFLEQAFLPIMNHMGPRIRASLIRPGYIPAGGGKLDITIEPVSWLQPFELLHRGKLLAQNATVLLSHLPAHIAQRELAVIGEMLHIPSQHLTYQLDESALGPGNCVAAILKSEAITEVFTALGKRGLPGEAVARQVVEEVNQYLNSGVPVGRFLADQLLVPLALARKGALVTGSPSSHTTTNMTVISQFTQRPFSQEHLSPTTCRIELI